MTGKPIFIALSLWTLPLVLSGCGNPQPDVTFQPAKPEASTGNPAPPPVPGTFVQPMKPVTSDGEDDPLSTPDQLPVDTDAVTKGHGTSKTTLAEDDPMENTEPRMPTDHSHWIRGGVFNADVSVALNGLKIGDYHSHIDKDITMKLRRGVNTVTFTYTPQMTTSAANIDLVESEHNPDIAPLATFRSPQADPDRPPQPVSQTFTFIAH